MRIKFLSFYGEWLDDATRQLHIKHTKDYFGEAKLSIKSKGAQ